MVKKDYFLRKSILAHVLVVKHSCKLIQAINSTIKQCIHFSLKKGYKAESVKIPPHTIYYIYMYTELVLEYDVSI